MQTRTSVSDSNSSPIQNFIKWLGNWERGVLIGFALIIGFTWIIVRTVEEVSDGDTQAFDEAVLLSLREPTDSNDPIGPPWFEEVIRDFTALGGTGLLTLVIVSVAGLMYMQDNKRQLVIILVSIAGALLISFLTKEFFDRPRPDLVAHGSNVRTASFPSGHSLLSASTYLTLGILLAQVQKKMRIRIFIMVLSIVTVILVGFSRVYLGVHWPTDVLAGWSIGAVWAMLCWLVAWRVFPKEMAEAEAEAVAEREVAAQKK